jgi:hypothetical protein
MTRNGSRFAPVAALLALASATTFSSVAQGDGVAIVDVSVPRGHEDVAAPLKLALEKELAALSLPKGKGLSASASLVTLDVRKLDGAVETKAVVSLAIRDHRGNLRLITNGSAALRSEKAGKTEEREVVTVAARGATRGLPAALAK